MSKNKQRSKQSQRAQQTKLRKALRTDLVYLLDGVWLRTNQMSLQELANKAGLHVSTVNRIYYGAFQFPRFETIQKLSRAAGYSITLTDEGGLNVVVQKGTVGDRQQAIYEFAKEVNRG